MKSRRKPEELIACRKDGGLTEIDSGDWDLLRDLDDVAQYDLKPRIGLGACER
jgi:hypothetical protein